MVIRVRRYNLAQEPQAFTANAAVLTELKTGVERLPVTVMDGTIVASGRYLSRAELAERLGLDLEEAPRNPFRVSLGDNGCGPGSACC